MESKTKTDPYIYLYIVVILILVLALTSLYYGLKIYEHNRFLQKELLKVRQGKSVLEGRLEVFKDDEEKGILTAVLLEESLARVEEERVLLQEQIVEINQECFSLRELLEDIREYGAAAQEELPWQIPYRVEFMDVAEIGGIYAELSGFGIKDNSFVGQIKNNWADPDFLFIDFEILIEFYNADEGVNFVCKPFHIIVQNQLTREFLYKPEEEWAVTPESMEDVKITIKQLLAKEAVKALDEPLEEFEEKPVEEFEERPEEETEETLTL